MQIDFTCFFVHVTQLNLYFLKLLSLGKLKKEKLLKMCRFASLYQMTSREMTELFSESIVPDVKIALRLDIEFTLTIIHSANYPT